MPELSLHELLDQTLKRAIAITIGNDSAEPRGELRAEILSCATTWLDTGTHESLYEAGGLIRTLQHRTGMRIGDVEQIARDQAWI